MEGGGVDCASRHRPGQCQRRYVQTQFADLDSHACVHDGLFLFLSFLGYHFKLQE